MKIPNPKFQIPKASQNTNSKQICEVRGRVSSSGSRFAKIAQQQTSTRKQSRLRIAAVSSSTSRSVFELGARKVFAQCPTIGHALRLVEDDTAAVRKPLPDQKACEGRDPFVSCDSGLFWDVGFEIWRSQKCA
jgi:hypothetical protein